jgi:hypothetical protein
MPNLHRFSFCPKDKLEKMEIHEEFTEWAVTRGVKINGIKAHRFDGRGLGIIAKKDFKVCKLYYVYCLVLFLSFVQASLLLFY